MYASFFGLNREPFSIAPDPHFLFMSEQHREALAHLLYGLGGGGGFVLLTGEIGAGKTTVFRCFLEQVPAHCAVAYVFNPKLTALELLQTVCAEFRIPLPAHTDSVKAHVDALNLFLLAGHAGGRQAVLVIDEAQALGAEVLEQLRLLTNLETAERKLLQIVLIGQPELREMVARPELEQLAQRITARYHLGALRLVETQQYIQHRLAVAGPSAPLPFSAAALARIHALSGGVPRRINLLAGRALLGAYAQGQARAEKRTVEQAAREVFGSQPARWPGAPRAGMVPGLVPGLLALVLLLGAGWLWTLRKPAPPPLAAGGAGIAASAAAVAAVPASEAASAAAAAGSTPAAAAAAAPAPAAVALSSDPQALLAAAHPEIGTAWRELALRWNVAIGEGDACVAALQARLGCYRSAAGGLGLLRQLDRPAVLSLRGAVGPQVHALLLKLDDQQATLQAGAERFELPLPVLAGMWRGEFATFWRLPPGWHDGAAGRSDATASEWLERGLTDAGFGPGRPLADRVWALQLAQGLVLDGRAGPLTLMRLNQLSGVDEPRLRGR
ncbi:MAG: peptidoglycan-binding protein [Leptothrix sp. (in: Bacteria)]|nr:peptidoglycan-binding protein [Leptothrix sp. (in: b-proteobacteria)]